MKHTAEQLAILAESDARHQAHEDHTPDYAEYCEAPACFRYVAPEYRMPSWPAWTPAGVRCGNHGNTKVRHATADDVRCCYAETEAAYAEADAVRRAEGAWLRQAESYGYADALHESYRLSGL